MKIFGLDINIGKKKDASIGIDPSIEKNYNGFLGQLSETYPNAVFGNSIDTLNGLRISKETTFFILKKNIIISAAWKLISDRVGANGFTLVDEKTGEAVETETNKKAQEILDRANYFFSIPSFRQYVYRTIGMSIGAGQVFAIPSETNGIGEATLEAKIKVLDSREVVINHDHYGTVLSYSYLGREKIPSFLMNDTIVYQDLDNPVYGQSQIESIVIDALTDYATSNRQLVFFRNNATPNVVYMLDPQMVSTKEKQEDFMRKVKQKHGGTMNSHNPMATTALKDVKVIEMSHKDLDLLNQRLFAHKEAGVIMGFDLRLLSYMKDSGGSYSEMDSLTLKNANSQLDVYAGIIENSMKSQYEQFIEKIPYRFKLKNKLFKDPKGEAELIKSHLEVGAITPNMGARILGYTESEDQRMDEHYLPSNLVSITGKKEDQTNT